MSPKSTSEPTGPQEALLPFDQTFPTLSLPSLLASVAFGLLVLTAMMYWIGALVTTLVSLRRIPSLRSGLSVHLPAASPKMCVIVPAHNESSVIEGLVKSLKAQDYPAARFVFVFDRCTDNSLDLAKAAWGDDPRFESIVNTACPDDWAGKVFAAHRGVIDSHAARDADILIFTDADTKYAPQCLQAAAGLMQARSLGLLSVLSTLTHNRSFEKFIQPAAYVELMHQYPLLKANRLKRRRPFANGQFMAFTRDAYNAIGTHAAVRSALLEDLALARLAYEKSIAVGVHLADGMLTCRMYPHEEAFLKGWSRIYCEAAGRRASRLRRWSLRPLLLGAVSPVVFGMMIIIAAIGVPLGAWKQPHPLIAAIFLGATVGFAAAIAAMTLIYRSSGAPLWTVLTYPFGAFRVSRLMVESANTLRDGKPISWGGRSYILTPEGAKRVEG